MQLTSPPSPVSDQRLDAITAAIAKGIRGTVTRRIPQGLLNPERQAINALAHIDRFDDQPYLICPDHFRTSRSHAAQAWAREIAQAIWKTGCWRRISI